MAKEVVTSFRVDAKLWKKARIYAIQNEISMKKLIETLLRLELRENRIKEKLEKGED